MASADLDRQLSNSCDINTIYHLHVFVRSFRHIRHKTVLIRPRDKPWMNTSVRRAIRKRNRLLKILNIDLRPLGKNIGVKEILQQL